MSLKFGYSNIGFFTSARNRSTIDAMHRLGYNVQMEEQLWLTSFSGTFLNYYLGGVKYYVTRENLQDNEIYGFELEEKYGDFYVYKNKNSFNIGYYLADDIKQSHNPFEMQNDILNKLIKANAEKRYFETIEKSKFLKCKKQVQYDEITQEYIIKYNVKAKKDCNIYLSSENKLNLNIEGKDAFEDYSNVWTFENGIKQIKCLKQKEEIEFTITTKDNPELVYIYVSDNEKIQQTLNRMSTNRFELQEIKKNGLTGTANFKDDGYLCLSIAYDKCWKIYVDGKETDTKVIAGAFLGVKLEKGVHKVELKASIIPIK